LEIYHLSLRRTERKDRTKEKRAEVPRDEEGDLRVRAKMEVMD